MDLNSILKRAALGATAAICMTGTGLAACVDTNADAPAIMVEMRSAMLEGKYRTFVAAADPNGLIPADQKQSVVDILNGNFPQGFDSCEVLVRKVHSDKVFEEVSVMSKTGKPHIFLYALGATIGGETAVLNFNFSENAAEEIGKLR